MTGRARIDKQRDVGATNRQIFDYGNAIASGFETKKGERKIFEDTYRLLKLLRVVYHLSVATQLVED